MTQLPEGGEARMQPLPRRLRAEDYRPLADYLAAQPAATTTVTLTLAEIEALLGKRLPLSARSHGWWRRQAPDSVLACVG